MKYNVITDKDGYVVLIRHTGSPSDFVELDLSDYDFTNDRLNAYKLTNDGLEFDQSKHEEIQNGKTYKQNQKEITVLQAKLDSTDYICAKNVEQFMGVANTILSGNLTPYDISITDQMALNFVKTIMTILGDSYAEYSNTIAERESARDGINNLQDEGE